MSIAKQKRRALPSVSARQPVLNANATSKSAHSAAVNSSAVQNALHQWEAFSSQAQAAAREVAIHDIAGLNGAAISFFISEMAQMVRYTPPTAGHSPTKTNVPIIIVTAGEREAADMRCDLATAMPGISINLIPWWGTIPYRPAAVSAPVFGERSASLSRLATAKGGVFITTERAFLSPLPPHEHITSRSVTFAVGDKIDTAETAKTLFDLGYTRVPRVHVHGEFSLRGEVIDIFIHGDEEPVRVKLDYDTIASIRHFDCDTQLASAALTAAAIAPAREVHWDAALVKRIREAVADYEKEAVSAEDQSLSVFAASSISTLDKNVSKRPLPAVHLPFTDMAKARLDEMLVELEVNGCAEGEELLYPLVFGTAENKPSTMADYAPNAVLVLVETERLKNSEQSIQQENVAMYRKARTELPCLPPSSIILDFDSMVSRFDHRVSFHSLHSTLNTQHSTLLNTEPSRSFFGNIKFLKETLAALKADGWQTAVYAGGENQAVRIKAILKGDDMEPLAIVLPDAITEGFSVPDIKLLVIQESEIFGRKRRAPSPSRKARSEAIDTFVELNPGDYVVHVNYGIGIFRSIDRVKALGQERDYIKLEYAEGSFVFVPTEQVNLVQRYIGSSGTPPKLDRIGTKSWEKRKVKTAKAVEEMAGALLDIYARREASVGHAFGGDDQWQASFEAAFPYEDTPDQAKVTEEIKRDMEKAVPMDRLICGDVGYGKTEVAMRAAFKAVMGGAQVAFLAPTTLLAEQHYDTCVERFKGFPVKIAVLSRFIPPAEQKKTLSALAAGNVDILVGTHRIIQKDVKFKNLGLLIIDEEQRFGVKDKEKLKGMRENIDVLAMSATPIPRTLHMSLLNIRDMSLLTTPPQNRQAVETVVEPYSDERVAQAIRREAERGGQVFFLHNRVESLDDTRSRIERLVPEMLVECAHGAMTADTLDDIFRRFKAGAFHVLVSTTIIENGIDIPNVNTIIIDRADMYGISQLYQLRGRVGRSDRKAYAYLLYPDKKALSEVAMKRLEAISDFTELGSGFKIAMKDMEIRGAGNLLGRDQSGEICSVGFDMYMRLLSQAVDRLKQSKDYRATGEVVLEVGYTGFIPDSYIDSSQTKMEVYKDIAAARTSDEIGTVEAGLVDRFGPVPQEVRALLSLAEVKSKASILGVRSIKECRVDTFSGAAASENAQRTVGNKEAKNALVIELGSASGIKIDRLLTLIKENPKAISLSSTESNKIFLKCGTLDSGEKIQFLAQVLERLA